MTDHPPLPPFTAQTAAQKVQAAEDAWNTRDPERVSLAYSEDSVWRNRDVVLAGRAEIVAFLTSKWQRELDYALRKDLWSWAENRIAVRFQYESHDSDGQWWRSYGNELWEFDEHGLMTRVRGRRRALPGTGTDGPAVQALRWRLGRHLDHGVQEADRSPGGPGHGGRRP
jgi:nuclear transport factor 2 (NTF2) superfamily protein